MIEEQYDLPDDWKWATVANVIADAQTGFASGQKDVAGGMRHLRMNNIGADCRLNLDSVLTVPSELAKPRHLLQPNDVLFCHTNSVKLVGKTALFDVKNGPYAFSNHLTRLRVAPDVTDPRWLWQVLATLWRERYFENRCKQWVNQATVERQTLLSAPVPLPPLPEQRRIVAKIERLFEQSRTARKALDGVPALMKRFRQSVLASAFRGELTECDPNDEPASVLLERIRAERRRKWKEALQAKGKDPKKAEYVEPEPLETDDLLELPEGWLWTNLGEVFDISYGLSESLSKTQPDSDLDVPVIRMPNVTEFGKLDLSNLKYFPLDEKKKKPLLVHKEDVLFNWRNAPKWIGKSAVFEEDREFVNASFLLKLRPTVTGYSNFVSLYLNYLRITGYFMTRVANAVNQANFNASMTKRITIPFPPLAEQRRIAAKVESLFAQAAAVERAVEVARRRAEKVDQAILARAFRGEL